MPTHDIIDNRKEKLVDHINRILGSTEAARFAVGYFFLSGLTPIAYKLNSVKELRLLIGNTTNRETLEQISEGYKRLELVAEEAEAQAYPKRTETKRMSEETGENLKEAVELMDQTDEGEKLIHSLVKMIEEKRLKVRVYTKGRLHAKAYIFDYGTLYDNDGNPVERHEKGIAIVGSSNLTLSGVTHNTELNVIVQGNDNHAELVRWFEDLWKESEDFDATLMQEMQQSWAMAAVTPYDIYMKTLYTLVKDRLEGGEEREILWDDEVTKKLADFQKVAVRQGVQTVLQYGGVFISDVVGMGKSYVGAAIIKHFERTRHVRPLIICPATLTEMWDRYNETYQLNARVLSMGYLREGDTKEENILLDDVKYRDRDFVLVDESHNFRHTSTQRYKLLERFLSTGRPCCFLTATPRNKSAWDIYNQIKLFHQDDRTYLPIDPAHLKEYFRMIDRHERKLKDMLINILIRRTRNHILRWYGYDAKTHKPVDPSNFRDYLDGKRKAYIIVGGRHQFFPKRELKTIQYSIEDTYQGLYEEIRNHLGKPHRRLQTNPPHDELTYARYGLWHYVKKEKQRKEPYSSLHRAGVNLRGLIRILLFKRFESSVYAFKETIRRLITIHDSFIKALNESIVPAGEDAQLLLYESDKMSESDLMDALKKVTGRYSIDDFEVDLLRAHIEQDIQVLKKLQSLVNPITPDQDDKLHTLKKLLAKSPLKGSKKIIFTQYADTARYLFENLNPGKKRDEIDVIFSGDKSKARVVGRFAPKANPEFRFAKGETELQDLVATDVLAEGLNLQDCDNCINYDLHWNPVKLIQRFGRIDRIGAEHEVVYGFNFLPETGIERQLGIREVLRRRIREIHKTIGEDSQILDETEQINEEAMYAIYEQKGDQLSLFEDEEDLLDLNEAEELLRQLQAEKPEEYERIVNLRDGIRTGKLAAERGTFVFCQAGQYNQLFILSPSGEIVSRDIPRVLNSIKCGPATPSQNLPEKHNTSVMGVKRIFSEEVKHRQAERDYRLSLRVSQKYVLRELRMLFEASEDEEEKTRINLLEKAFRGPINNAINRELNFLRRNSITGKELLKSLSDIYLQHNMKDWMDRGLTRRERDDIPKIICSEALI